jgi:hypothetical protein
MAIGWTDPERRDVSDILTRHPVTSNRCADAAREILPVAKGRDPEAKAILIKPRIGWCVLPKRSHGVEWHHHVSTNALMHYVDAITGVDGTPQDAYLSTHWQYADSYIIADADLSDDSL